MKSMVRLFRRSQERNRVFPTPTLHRPPATRGECTSLWDLRPVSSHSQGVVGGDTLSAPTPVLVVLWSPVTGSRLSLTSRPPPVDVGLPWIRRGRLPESPESLISPYTRPWICVLHSRSPSPGFPLPRLPSLPGQTSQVRSNWGSPGSRPSVRLTFVDTRGWGDRRPWEGATGRRRLP